MEGQRRVGEAGHAEPALRRAFLVPVVAVLAACGEGPAPTSPPIDCRTEAGGVGQLRQADQAFAQLRTNVEIFLDEDAGGPLTCVPGRGDCEPCVGSAVDIALGVSATLAIEVRNVSAVFVDIVDIVIEAGSDPAFTLQAPLPTRVEAQAQGIFVGATPTVSGVVTATFLLQTDADNMDGAPYPVTLTINGVE